MWIVVRYWHDNDVCVDKFDTKEYAEQFYKDVLRHTAATVYLAKVEEFAEGAE
ncbi:hypothetical protein, partial [Shouchella clausii]|uniref:hypothetical protein n=1 Tax=Shouchella clausii TaxID=79880 RepID=UPI0015951EF9